MRRRDKEITESSVLLEILDSALVCRLGLVDGDRPYIVPMNFVRDGETLLLHCAREGRKLEILAKNPNVCFEVEADVELVKVGPVCDWGMRYRTVIGFGVGEVEDTRAEKVRAFGLLAAKYGGVTDPDLCAAEVEKTRLVRVAIKEIHGKQSKPR